MDMDYTASEMMALCAGRLVHNGDILFAGTGLSMLAATVAKRIHAHEAVVFFETGGIDPSLIELPLAVGDPRVMVGTSVNSGLADALSLLGHPKLRTIAFLGAAQIDPYGNLNSTMLGTYEQPLQRFPGSGGACDAASMASGTIIFMQHQRRRFVETLDYFTSPGWLTGGKSRQEAVCRRLVHLAKIGDFREGQFSAGASQRFQNLQAAFDRVDIISVRHGKRPRSTVDGQHVTGRFLQVR